MGALSAGISPSRKHPLGAASPDGGLLCHEHRLTTCHVCGELSPLGQMERREVGKHVDRETRGDMPPRIEPVFGHHCSGCAAHARQGEPNGWLMGGLVLAAGVLLVGLVLLLR